MTERIRLDNQTVDGTLTPAKIAATGTFVFPSVHVTATDTGFLPPSLSTAQRDAIATPVAGMIIWNTDTIQPEIYNGSAWVTMGGGSGGSVGGAGRTMVAAVTVNGDHDGVALTSLYTPPAAGTYAISAYALCTGLASSPDTVNASLTWNDGVGVFASVQLGITRQYYLLGAAASIVEQDLTYTAQSLGEAGNSIVIQYLDDGTAGAETVNVVGTTITVHEQSGVSTADQIKAAVDAFPAAIALVATTVTGTGSNPQTVLPDDNLVGGQNSATVTAGGATVTYGVEWAIAGDEAGAAANLIAALNTAPMTDVIATANGQTVTFHSTTPGTPGNAFTISYFDPGVEYHGGTTAFDLDGAPSTKTRNFTGGADEVTRLIYDNNTNSSNLQLNTDQTGRFQNETIVKVITSAPIKYQLVYNTGNPPGDGTYTYYFIVEKIGSPVGGVTELSAPATLVNSGFYWVNASFIGGRIVLPDASLVAGETFALNSMQSIDHSFQPFSICTGPDGNLWFSDVNSRIFKMTPDGTLFMYPTVTGSQVYGVCAGPDGNVWFCEEGTVSNIGVITPSGVVTEYPTPTSGAGAFGICTGSDGNLWFTEFAANQIGQCTIAGVITEFPTPTGSSQPKSICSATDNNLWFTESGGGINQIGKCNTAGAITEYPTTTPAGPNYIVQGSDGNLWFTEQADLIGTMDLTGAMVNEFATVSSPTGICAGPDSNLWFLLPSSAQVVKMDTSGSMTPYNLLSGGAAEICNGPDGNLWASCNSSLIFKITTAGEVFFERTSPSLATPTGQAIDGTDTYHVPFMLAGQVIRVISDGSNWHTT